MYKTILVPLDGSKRAEKILPHVEGLAAQFKSQVTLLQVVVPAYYMMDPQLAFANVNLEETEWRVGQAKEYLDTLKKRLGARDIQCERRVEQGPVVETIIELARKGDYDLIAMASHGRTGLARVFYGSIAAGMLQSLDRPILLIRSRDED